MVHQHMSPQTALGGVADATEVTDGLSAVPGQVLVEPFPVRQNLATAGNGAERRAGLTNSNPEGGRHTCGDNAQSASENGHLLSTSGEQLVAPAQIPCICRKRRFTNYYTSAF